MLNTQEPGHVVAALALQGVGRSEAPCGAPTNGSTRQPRERQPERLYNRSLPAPPGRAAATTGSIFPALESPTNFGAMKLRRLRACLILLVIGGARAQGRQAAPGLRPERVAQMRPRARPALTRGPSVKFGENATCYAMVPATCSLLPSIALLSSGLRLKRLAGARPSKPNSLIAKFL